ncbi:dolichyl-P-Man:Man(5)GlcNAc(2)-PP-dolichol alpha-1,3-mannosyltransferase NDAI_0E04080 [Naumovozyma dairenensis CBS 421]|uniref:Dol-P-Man:Man(5)GlcNAc(2)-PP-Dol alpha-1,3-mannosyltransferase n=1 Tax=Naumovozyma dairenensis (strain ATCC 10597 / BCRC 20456 / CBS 421 / NBRC 0211 / NRRL Y-12639) TaxID=1071378 RepID=G0WBV5_NAUDC|nr:hypothetical protein NDAI_0E04080 [Naumovozyma dairenensis CBS 421]CCD25225.1 hypothetical protein NDAI_0E04080 [Naumovozyma dairenensis CBS 421]
MVHKETKKKNLDVVIEDITTTTTTKKNETKPFERPPIDLIQDMKDGIRYILFNNQANLIIMPILLLIESIVLKYIIFKIPYTEIDYKAYMEQIEMITYDNELDYSKIRGGTGPLVYPAGHVFIYKLMYKWITDGMENIHDGQVVFRYLYLITLLGQFICYYIMGLKPWCVVLACMSKRLHSIYVLRLFNDCFTTAVMVWVVVLLLCGGKLLEFKSSTKKMQDNSSKTIKKWHLICLSIVISILYSFAISIKMNALLYFPSIMISLYLINEGQLLNIIGYLFVICGIQTIIALPFLKTYPMEYFENAFNFGRKFMFEWSINWQFLHEDAFNNEFFHLSLLICHVMLLLTVILIKYPDFLLNVLESLSYPLSETITNNKDNLNSITSIICYIVIVTNFVGVIFSRSLHYQFLSWYHWTLPLLIHWSHMPIYLGPMWYLIHEYCWNSYPPNKGASILLTCVNDILLFLVIYYHGDSDVSTNETMNTKVTMVEDDKKEK